MDLSFKLKTFESAEKMSKKQLLVSLESTLVGSVSGVTAWPIALPWLAMQSK